ncbi:MAG: DUF6125 family protein [Christensenellales bacterium]
MSNNEIIDLSREKLLELCHMYAKNWLATDGLWFQSIEAKYGIDEALEHDANMWGKFAVIEADRIKKFLSLQDNPGIEGLKKALSLRLYATLNEDEFIVKRNTLIYRVITCRVQNARLKKGMAYHPCKPVGLIEYTNFAKTIDERFETEVVSCHPNITDDSCNCIWKFTLKT